MEQPGACFARPAILTVPAHRICLGGNGALYPNPARMTHPFLAAALAVASLTIPPSAHATAQTLAPSWGFCGGSIDGSNWPNPQPRYENGNVACDRATGAAHISADRLGLAETGVERLRAQVSMYAGDVIGEGVRHRRYTTTFVVEEAWVQGITGPAGSQIDLAVALVPLDCERNCSTPATSVVIAGGPLAPQRIQDRTVIVVLDVKPDTLAEDQTLRPGRYSVMVLLTGGTEFVNVGDTALRASVSQTTLVAETID